MINNYKDPCERTSINGNRMKVSVIKNFWFRKSNQDKLFSSNVARHCLMSWKGVVWNWYALNTKTNNSSSNRSTTTSSSSTNKKKNNKKQQPHQQQQEEHQEQREQETTSKPTSRANLVSSRRTFWQASAEDKRKKILDKVIKELRKVGIPNTSILIASRSTTIDSILFAVPVSVIFLSFQVFQSNKNLWFTWRTPTINGTNVFPKDVARRL